MTHSSCQEKMRLSDDPLEFYDHSRLIKISERRTPNAERMLDIISIGDSTVDVFLHLDEASTVCDLDRVHCRMCLPYGGKVPVHHMMSVNGAGNAANCAVAWSRLGLSTAIYTMIGDDDRGKDIRQHLRQEKVMTDYIVVDKEHGTNYSTILEYKGDRTILGYHEDRHYILPTLPPARWVYFSSIAGNHTELNGEIITYLKKAKARFGFNPGTRQMQLGLKGLKSILEQTTIFFVNTDEAMHLLGIKNKKPDFNKILTLLQQTGPEVVVITDGNRGSYCHTGVTSYYAPIVDVPVVQHTGCGDAYASGFIAALFYGETPAEAMRWGSMNAAGVIGHEGSQTGLLQKKKLVQLLIEHKECQVSLI